MDSHNQAIPRTAATDVDRRQRICPIGTVINSYLDRATGDAERARRSRRVQMWGSRLSLGMSLEDIAAGFGVTQPFVSKETAGMRAELRIEATRIGFSEEHPLLVSLLEPVDEAA
jgi:hypothetical protein